MLDIKIRKTIDEARDILAGKIPVPNTQVEQITIALLYKLIDDMDQEASEMGGKARFFIGDYEKYSWKNIMSNKIGSQERYNLYTEALEKFYNNNSLPQTFRDIFKNAIVPYKDPDVLTMFLRKIETGLSDANSKQHGDAYEYLLMMLVSQGDLGQFRTPRHIIDFMVCVLEPKLNEKILDPACGTAGFLIAAYSYILHKNTSDNSKILGNKLNYIQRIELLKNIIGYEIDPSMVRIAKMNLYLHGINNPDIREYDTLTYDDYWDEKFDVILANPPFITPKGGVIPHKKFTVKANRSEILFVDFINEHLKSSGRGGIVVPEGVLFNNASAYKNLRERIIKKNLVAVVSLPNGIFMPYSGVKTSILFFDGKLAKDNKNILFIKLNNDGFSLDTQRKEIKGSELPEIISIINEFKENKPGISKMKSKINFTIVSKNDVLSNNSALNVGRYLKPEIEEKAYEDTEAIIKRIEKRNKDYDIIVSDLKRLLE